MVVDVYNSQKRFEEWKIYSQEYGIDGLSDINSKLVLDYITDMELGRNIARGTKKGSRSYKRLNTLSVRVPQIIKWFNINDIRKVSEDTVIKHFDNMKKGRFLKKNGDIYKSVADFIKDFKSFWHWLMKVSKKNGEVIIDITTDLDTTKDENSFVYFTKEELDKLLPYFTEDEQIRMLFMFDTIIRSPTELLNVKVSDINDGELNINDETSKTYGRRIKLLLCKDTLDKYIKRNKLKDEDYLFKFSPPLFNKKLKTVALELFKNKISKGGKKYNQLTMYDFRHSGACYWRIGAYRSKIDSLMYRGGWSNLEVLNYYTKKLGMKDSIEKEDLLVTIDKNLYEKQIGELKNNQQLMLKLSKIIVDKELGSITNKQFMQGISELMHYGAVVNDR